MSNSWAIIIGINQYQGFQPLMQAQNDAVGIRRYLIEEAGFPPENCILLSDLSKSTDQEAVFPDRVAIYDWIETICQGRVQEEDTLWFYFSGYGAQANNQDYLMPVDGDPAQVKQTGIALQDVVKHIKQAPTKNTMMVLDMNRSQSALAGQAIGEQVIKLARKARIPLILSCQPNEFSHETLAVRHGLFTAALLEGLRYDGCATLSHLERYLIERIPELCEHHWRPIQNPVVMLPEEQKFQLLWHQRDAAAVATAEAGATTAMATPATDMAIGEQVPDTEFLIPDSPESDLILDNPDADLIPDNPDADLGDEANLIPDPTPVLNLEEELPEESPQEPFLVETDTPVDGDIYGTAEVDELPEEKPVKGNWGGCIGLLVAFAALGLLLAVLFRNQALVQSTLQDRVPPEWLARIGLGETDGEGEPDGEPEGTDTPDTAAGEVPAEPGDDTAAPAPDNPDAETPDNLDAETSAETDTPVVVEPDGAEAETEAETPDGEAEGAEDAGTPTEPVAAAGNTAASPTSTDDGAATAALLEDARRSLRPSQASRFASAIATARQIPPGDPNYAQAQADIQRWSQVILDLAEGRAADNELDAAISAAQLVPREPANLYSQAQDRIGLWQERAGVRALIREAQAIPRMGQASTYQRGILKLQEVPDNLPTEHADAQRLITEWSGRMLSIAQARAAQGRFFSAIEAAELIPEDTASYDQAQAEIRRWRGE
ncbi:peptidase c14 [Leptolyngbya sp. Heron Island J]|uniref:caspase family protein n=1 Tax=Leptolyngbya sp. Heron Island J TaxID=1385935 RepID=UPI0003B9A094|nr:caspase family protein [Leptolyngbya sp. Heron Island J]ESA36980.1 peptidase c14 [Leptolyngbya sp. Heron Island J]